MTDTAQTPSDGSGGRTLGPSHEPRSQEPDLLPGWSSLVMLLTLFALVATVSLLAILKKDPGSIDSVSGGTIAYGPADFPEIDFDEPLIPAVLAASSQDTGNFNVPPPPFSDDMLFPCSACHEPTEVNYERRELEYFHDEVVLNHGSKERWCFDCHHAEDRDHLRLASGESIGFEESYRLCGQCHGTIFRDWRAGIHGRRRGFWNGAKSYLLCAHCHDPHAPAYRALAPLPPPVRPEALRSAGQRREEPVEESE